MTTFHILEIEMLQELFWVHIHTLFFKAVKKSGIPNIRRHTDFSVYLWEIADALKFLSLLGETYVKLKSDCIFQFTYLQTYRK